MSNDPGQSAELKPCPWCGEPGQLLWDDNNAPYAWARCSNSKCKVYPVSYPFTREEAIEAWNRRASDGERDTLIGQRDLAIELRDNYAKELGVQRALTREITAERDRLAKELGEARGALEQIARGAPEYIKEVGEGWCMDHARHCLKRLAARSSELDCGSFPSESEWKALMADVKEEVKRIWPNLPDGFQDAEVYRIVKLVIATTEKYWRKRLVEVGELEGGK